MDDSLFTTILNRLTREKDLDVRGLSGSKDPRGEEIAAWVDLLQCAIREGIALSDSRWRRLTVETGGDRAVFALRPAAESEPDEDFRLGLQLFMTMLGGTEEE